MGREVTVDVVGEGVERREVDADARYADVVRAVGYSVHEVAVLVDGRHVPTDAPVESGSVTVLRLVKGGAADTEGSVRVAGESDRLDVVRLLDAALLEVASVDERVAAGDVLVRTVGGSVVGAVVLDGARVVAVAVRRERRDRGHGRALVRAARSRRGPLTASFRPAVRGFYESLGFDVERADADGGGERLRGELR
jgi:sulfur carrier protein ThiS/GNAT superfamily N-acetyltransferase